MNINGLNDDCLALIFSLIPFKQLIVSRSVCKHWRKTIDNYVSNERHLVYNQSINWCKRDHYFYKYKENVESLMDLNQFEKCVQLMPKLTAITLKGIKANDGMLPILANNCPNLRRLHCLFGEESLTFCGFQYLVKKYPLLTHLDLPNCQLDDDLIHIIAVSLQNLVHLNFGTDKNRGTRTFRLSRFTGHTLRKIGHKIKTLMIGESMYWDEQLITSLIQSNARNVTTLKIHLIKLKSLRTICENMSQLKRLYCSFNGQDINTHENNIGCIKHIEKLHNLEVLELIDDGRLHCGVNCCSSVYTLSTLTQMCKGLPQLKTLQLLDFNNWHSNKPNIDSLLSVLKEFCPNLVEFGISAGLFQLKTESYGLISMLNIRRLTVQGDTSLLELPHSGKHDYLTNEVVVDLLKSNPCLHWLKVENCPLIDEQSIGACLELTAERSRQRFELIFTNIGLNSTHQISDKIPENVSLVITKDEDELTIDLDDYTGGSSSFESSDMDSDDSIQLFSENSDTDNDIL